MTLAGAKAAARKAAFQRRKSAHRSGRDADAQDHLKTFLQAWSGHTLAGYMPILSELDPLPVMRAWSGDVGVPVVMGKGQALTFRRWTAEVEMVEGAFGVQVPAEGPQVTPSALIVPLVAFDAQGYRLGYGGGFYDRTLDALRAEGPPIIAVGFAYAAQEAQDLPREPTDQRLDAIVTERGVRQFR